MRMPTVYKISIKRGDRPATTIYESRLELIADVYEIGADEIIWAIEEHGKCECETADGAEVTIEEATEGL